MIRDLIRDALAQIVAGWRAGTPADVTVVWQLELSWGKKVDQLQHDWADLSDGIADRLRGALSELAAELEQLAATGADIDQMRQGLERWRSGWEGWARKVATTESTRIASETVLASDRARRPGAMKEWVSSHDDRVRASHSEADGERVPVSGSWMVGGWPIRYPGDPYGPPEEVIGCRCGVRIVDRSGT